MEMNDTPTLRTGLSRVRTHRLSIAEFENWLTGSRTFVLSPNLSTAYRLGPFHVNLEDNQFPIIARFFDPRLASNPFSNANIRKRS